MEIIDIGDSDEDLYQPSLQKTNKKRSHNTIKQIELQGYDDYTKKQKRKKLKAKSKIEGTSNKNYMEESQVIKPKVTEYAIKWQEVLYHCLANEGVTEKRREFDRYDQISTGLVQHPRCKNVSVAYRNGGRKVYCVRQRVIISGKAEKYMSTPYGGLTERLMLAFHPDTSENPIEKGKRNKELGGREPIDKEKKKSHKENPCSKFGAQHGTMVHNQFERITAMLTSNAGFEKYEKMSEDIDNCTSSFIDICISRRWFPVKSEFIVYDEDLKIATAIDMLLVDVTTWKLIAVEFKTGYEGEEYTMHPNDVNFGSPLSSLTNCPLNRHFLQLMTMTIILEKKYQTKVDESYVVRMCPKLGVIEIFEEPDWCKMNYFKRTIYDTLLSDAAVNKR